MSTTDQTQTDAEVHRVLEQRAVAFARPLVKRGIAGEEVVLFRVIHERFVLQLASVVEIARVATLAPLPGAAQPIAGVVAWRGRAVLIIDLAHPPRADIPIDEETRVIMIGRAGHIIGFVADEVEDVTRIDVSTLTQAASDSWRSQVILGLSADAFLVLDPAELLRRFAAPGTITPR